MRIRDFTPADTEALAALYRDAVREIGPQAYTPAQVDAWALYPEDLTEFSARLSRGTTLVAESEQRAVAFGQLDPADHIAFLYTASAFGRRGLATEIYGRLEARAVAQGARFLDTEASRISRGLFAKLGFALREVERVTRYGVEFERFRMRKKLEA